MTDSGVPNGSRAAKEMGLSLFRSTVTRLVAEKKYLMLVIGGSASVKQGTYFRSSAISSLLGVRGA